MFLCQVVSRGLADFEGDGNVIPGRERGHRCSICSLGKGDRIST